MKIRTGVGLPFFLIALMGALVLPAFANESNELSANELSDETLLSASPNRYVFSINNLEAIAKSVAGLSGSDGKNRKFMLDETNRKIKEMYPELIIDVNEGDWIFNSVGGSLAEIKIMYCSPSEYMALWGAPLKTDGFSGRYFKMDVWDIMLDGKMTSYAPGGDHQLDTYMNVGGAGTHQTSWLKKGIGKHFRLEDGAYMIDYGRGDLLDSLSSGAVLGHENVTGDMYSLQKMLGTCAKETFKNWLTPERRRAIRHYKETNPDYP